MVDSGESCIIDPEGKLGPEAGPSLAGPEAGQHGRRWGGVPAVTGWGGGAAVGGGAVLRSSSNGRRRMENHSSQLGFKLKGSDKVESKAGVLIFNKFKV